MLRNDLASSSEHVMGVTLNGRSMGGKCNPNGGDYDCTFFRCPYSPMKVTSSSGSIQANIRLTGHSKDCDCDESTWQCSKEGTVPGRTPVTAAGRFTLTPEGGEEGPAPRPSPQTKALVNLGASPPRKLQACEGDCDRDSDCVGSLQCWQRQDGGEAPGWLRDGRKADPDGSKPPPGCQKGGAGDKKNDDYCYDPAAPGPAPRPAPLKKLVSLQLWRAPNRGAPATAVC